MPKSVIFNYVSHELYEQNARELEEGEIRNIYYDNGVQIDIKRIGKDVYKFINKYGKQEFEVCLKNMYNNR